MENYLFIVEGNHDAAYISKLLKLLGYNQVRSTDHLNRVMKSIVPSKFPFCGSNLEIFNCIPFFFEKDLKQVAIINGNGETNLLFKLDEVLSEINTNIAININHIFIIADGDLLSCEDKIKRILSIDFDKSEFIFIKKSDLENDNPHVKLLEGYSISLKYYILPNNEKIGKLENVLLKSIEVVNNDLFEQTRAFIETIDPKYKSNWSHINSKREKTTVGIIGNVLVPGSSNTTSISHNSVDWISTKTVEEIDELKHIYLFLNNCIG